MAGAGARIGAQRLTTLLAGFCVAEEAVSEHLTPFTEATADTLVAWVFFLQRRDEQRHALLFDRVAAEVLGLPGATAAERRAAAREHVTPELLELFEVRLPAIAAELADRSYFARERREPLPHAARGDRVRRRATSAAR